MDLNRDAIRLLPVDLQIEIEENVRRQPLTQTELARVQRDLLEVLLSQRFELRASSENYSTKATNRSRSALLL